MAPELIILAIVIVTALVFDFTNGFHDTANAMATSIATGAYRPKVAVTVSAVLNLVGAFLSVEVAKTISDGIVDETMITPAVVFGGLVGAITWNLLTWFFGLPSSSSHALIGGLIGATWVAAGENAVHFGQIIEKVVIPALAAPLVAGLASVTATVIAHRLTKHAEGSTVSSGFRYGQMVSSGLLSLSHGTNDAQKTMGVITLTLIAAGTLRGGAGPPMWVILSCGIAIAVGTYAGGWRIIRTLGTGITDVEPRQGFAAETASTAVILASSHLGFSLSTTHVVSGGVVGAGLGKKGASVRWSTAGKMVIAWVVTLPAAALVGALASTVAETGATGQIAVALVAGAIGLGVYLLSRRNVVDASTVSSAATTPAETTLTEVTAPVFATADSALTAAPDETASTPATGVPAARREGSLDSSLSAPVLNR